VRLSSFKPLPASESKVFDAIRAVSALFVFIGHLYQIIVLPTFYSAVVTRGFFVLAGYSVMIFFVISGYLIGLSLYRNTSKHNFVRFDAAHFMRNRMLRLYPPLVAAFLICLSVSVLSAALLRYLSVFEGDRFLLSLSEVQPSLLASLLFAQNMFRDILPTPDNNFPLWSLSFEFWFYVIAALVASSFINRRWLSVIALVVIGVFIVTVGNWEAFLPGMVVWLTGFMGAIVRQNTDLAGRHARLVLLALTVVSGLVWIAAVLRIVDVPWLEAKYLFGVLFSLALMMFLSLFRKATASASRLRSVRIVASVAPYSFTLYLIHYPLALLTFAVFNQFIVGNFALSAALAILTFVVVLGLANALAHVVENKSLIEKQYILASGTHR
jgi:peptidoglycan/LPS O-acetylase OafA/YrhL